MGGAWGWSRVLSPRYPLKQVVVKGTRHLTPGQILQWAALEGGGEPPPQPELGSSSTRGSGAPGGSGAGRRAPVRRVGELGLWQVDLKAVASRLKSHPWIEAVAIERDLPDRLVLTVRERIAWARLEGPPSYLVSGEGIILQRVLEGEARPPLPRLLGGGGRPYLPGERIGKAELLRALEILKEARRCPWALRWGILQVDLSQRERLVVTLGSGMMLRFGPTDVRGSWARLQAVASRIGREEPFKSLSENPFSPPTMRTFLGGGFRIGTKGGERGPVLGGGAPVMIDLSFNHLVVVGSLASFFQPSGARLQRTADP